MPLQQATLDRRQGVITAHVMTVDEQMHAYLLSVSDNVLPAFICLFLID